MVIQRQQGLHLVFHQAIEIAVRTSSRSDGFPEWCIAGLVASGAATIGFYHANHKLRSAVDEAVAPLEVPERRRRGYSDQDLVDFRTFALSRPTPFGKSALEIYRERVLKIDIGFAVALGLFSLLGWIVVAQQVGHPLALSFAMLGGFASFLYGLSDFGEDVMLGMLLNPDRAIHHRKVERAAAFTLLKMITIWLSLFGGAAFGVLWLVYKVVPSSSKS